MTGNIHKKYLVSVRLMTYNHAPFVKEALDGVLLQRATFDVEVVIGDDFSTDGTLEIVKSYAGKEGIDIKVLERRVGGEYWQKRSKLGRLYNYIDILQHCSGEYVAILDGDDYWQDPFKLQKQVSLLEERPDLVMCAHEVDVLADGSLKKDSFEPGLYSAEYVISEGRVGHTASYVFRNVFKGRWCDPSILKLFGPDIVSGDRALQLILSTRGAILLMEGRMAVYRRHESGVTNSSAFQRSQALSTYTLLRRFDDFSQKSMRKHTKRARQKCLELMLIKDTQLLRKFQACGYAFAEGILYGFLCLVRLPFYLFKSVLFKLKANWFRHAV
jgi:glycosyltransferase involved in cell wall biosynthesis